MGLDEYFKACKIESEYKGNNKTLLSAIGVLEEVAGNVAEDGSLPAHSRQYLLEKMEAIKKAIE